MLSKLSVPDRSGAQLCVHFPRWCTTMGTFGETEARSPTSPLLRRNNQVGSLLKFFALTFAATWTCFIAAVAISHGSAVGELTSTSETIFPETLVTILAPIHRAETSAP